MAFQRRTKIEVRFTVVEIVSAIGAFLPKRIRPAWRLALLAAWLLPAVATVRGIIDDFQPCSRASALADIDVSAGLTVPADVFTWLHEKSRACAEGRFEPIVDSADAIRWGPAFPWIEGRTTVLVHRRAAAATLTLRHPRASLDRPIRIEFDADGRGGVLILDSPDWRTLTLQLPESWRVALRRMHRVDLRVRGGDAQALELRPVSIAR